MKKKLIIAVVCFLALAFVGFLGSDSEAPADATTEFVGVTEENQAQANETEKYITDNSVEKTKEKTDFSGINYIICGMVGGFGCI